MTQLNASGVMAPIPILRAGGAYWNAVRDKAPASSPTNSKVLARAALVLVAALLVIELWWELPFDRFFALANSVQRVEDWLGSLGAWAVAGSIALMVAHSFLPFPAEIVALANGMVFGPLWGAVVSWVGAMLGAATAFSLVSAGVTVPTPLSSYMRCCIRSSRG